MDTFESFEKQLYTVNASTFDNIALSLFRYQAQNNPLYSEYIRFLGIAAGEINCIKSIPYLPISFFKRHAVKTGTWHEEAMFTSSGTTGEATSVHLVKNLRFYLTHAERCFTYFFGSLQEFHFLALLPSYLERRNSSLIAMMEFFIKKSGSEYSGFYLNEIEKLLSDLEKLRTSKKRVILWGVSFALLDLAEREKMDLSHCLIFETGGMKGRRKEIIRTELHQYLRDRLNVQEVYSEYGMTELFSQAYTRGREQFEASPWMKVVARDVSDPFEIGLTNETGALNVIDLANWHSVAFLETEDLGKCYPDGTFEVLGRMDNSDARGCNLLLS